MHSDHRGTCRRSARLGGVHFTGSLEGVLEPAANRKRPPGGSDPVCGGSARMVGEVLDEEDLEFADHEPEDRAHRDHQELVVLEHRAHDAFVLVLG